MHGFYLPQQNNHIMISRWEFMCVCWRPIYNGDKRLNYIKLLSKVLFSLAYNKCSWKELATILSTCVVCVTIHVLLPRHTHKYEIKTKGKVVEPIGL